MKNETKALGSFTLLTGLGATLVAGLLAWVFSTTLGNKVTFAPLTEAIDKLNGTVDKLVDKLGQMDNKIHISETKLQRVIEDCEAVRDDLDACKATHLGGEHGHSK